MSYAIAAWAIEAKCPSPIAKLVLIDLADRCDQNGYCFPSRETVAARTQLSESTVRRAEAALAAAGMVEIRPRFRAEGTRLAQTSNSYRLLCRAALDAPDHDKNPANPDCEWRPAEHHTPCQADTPGVQREPGGGSVRPPNLSLNRSEEISPSLSASALRVPSLNGGSADPPTNGRSLTLAVRASPPPGFEQFWAECPRKVGKGAAMRAWKGALFRASAEAIMAGLRRQVAAGALDNGRFTPHPATWLNQGRWDDDPAASANLAPDKTRKRTSFDALMEVRERYHQNGAF